MKNSKNIVELLSKDISPVIKRSYLFTHDICEGKLENRRVNYYEIELITYSDGAMIIDEQMHKIHKNDIIFRKPGQSTQGILPYSCYAVIFQVVNFEDESNIYINSFLDSIPQIFNTKYPDRYVPFFEAVIKEYINPPRSQQRLSKSAPGCLRAGEEL